MSFDILGKANDKYFGRSNWVWRPLWEYVYSVAAEVVGEKTYKSGNYNNGKFVSSMQAALIGGILRAQLDSGAAAKYVMDRQARLDAMPNEPCNVCGGTGTRPNGLQEFGADWVKWCNGCNGCKGEKTKRPSDTWYSLDIADIREFADFCLTCEGFEIY